MQSSYQLVRVFNKSKVAEGNQAAIFLSAHPITLLQNELISISADIYKDEGVATTCFTSELEAGQYEVQCFNNKSEIQCCGHGMIAAAKNIFIENKLSKIVINKHIYASRNIDEAGHDVVILTLPRLAARLQMVPGWANDIIGFENKKLTPDKSAVSEYDDGYLLLELTSVLPLKVFREMQLDINKICDNTKRAVVIIQFDKEKESLAMRYFAPQYGVEEDVATGSVMRFVADYIENNYQCVQFEVTQHSSLGGYMKVNCRKENIFITANASMES